MMWKILCLALCLTGCGEIERTFAPDVIEIVRTMHVHSVYKVDLINHEFFVSFAFVIRPTAFASEPYQNTRTDAVHFITVIHDALYYYSSMLSSCLRNRASII